MNYLLFTTTQCPKCPAFKEFIQKNIHFGGEIIDQNNENFYSLSREFLVNSVPTLFIFEDETRDGALLRTSEVSDVYDFIHSH
jgi:hypothetical protein